MTPLRRITAFFNIHSGEERLIGGLILLYFVLALAFVFVQSMAFGVFIAEYGPQGLPYSYISIAFLASLAAVLYLKLGERVSFATQLFVALISLGIVCLLTWLGLNSPLAHEVAFLLPLWFQILANLGNLIVWQLAGRLFDFRQGKRLFGLLGVGLWLGNIIGGFLVPSLVIWMGAIHLLLLATGGLALAALVLRALTRTYLHPTTHPVQTRHAAKPIQQPELHRNPYILLIFAYIILWWVAFFFVDNIFYDRAATQYPNADQLTAFTGQLLSVTGIVALITSTFLTGRIIGRFGLRAGLIGMPLFVTLALGVMAVGGSLGAGSALGFEVGTFTKLINVAFGFSLSQSANAIVYQSLSDNLRRQVQATAEGVVQPIAIGLAGLSLLGLTAGLKLDYIGLSYVFLGLAGAWLFVIVRLSGNYVAALTQAITKRRLGDSPNNLADPNYLDLLRDRLSDPHPSAVIYALTRLEDLDPRGVASALPNLIQHPAPEVRCEAFQRIEYLALTSALNAVCTQLDTETTPYVREAALRALAAIADIQALPRLTDILNETDASALRGALIGLLKYGRDDSGAAEKRFNQLLHSPEPGDRLLTAQILGHLDLPQFQQAHLSLLHDTDPTIRREALESAGKIRQPQLYPFLIEACDTIKTSLAAANALTAIGLDGFPYIEAAFSQPSAPPHRLITLAKVMGRISERSQANVHAILFSRLDTPDTELRTQILNALSQSGYHTKDQTKIHSAIKAEVRWVVWACAVQETMEEGGLLFATLQQFQWQARERVLFLLSFLFDAPSILRVRETFLSGSTAQVAYALEIVDTQLPPEWKRMVMPVLEDIPPHERLQRLADLFPQKRESQEAHLRALIESESGRPFSAWVRACAIDAAVRLGADSCQDVIAAAASDPNSLVCNTARRALPYFSPDSQGGNVMLSIIEKVLILKTVNMFSRTPDNVLADVAELLEEVEAAEGETIFNQGELGDSMYVIVDGKVRVHHGERLLNYLGERDVFGEMALLDPEPRVASVTAVEQTRLFRLDQAPFYELMAERPEVATGIIRVLIGHLRDRVQDIAQLDARIKELENEVRHE